MGSLLEGAQSAIVVEMFRCRTPKQGRLEKIHDAMQSLINSKKSCEAVVRKNENLKNGLTNDIHRIMRGAVSNQDKVRHLLIQRKLLTNQISNVQSNIVSIFNHQLILEQAMLNCSIGDSLNDTVVALSTTTEVHAAFEELSVALESMSNTVCEVSESLSSSVSCDNIDVDNIDLDEELRLLESLPDVPVHAPTASAATDTAQHGALFFVDRVV